MSTPEAKVKAMVKRRLAAEFPTAWTFWPVQNGMGKPALDCFISHCGLFFVIETKKFGGKLTLRQKETVREIQSSGAQVYVVDDGASLDAAVDSIHRTALCAKKSSRADGSTVSLGIRLELPSSPLSTAGDGSGRKDHGSRSSESDQSTGEAT